VTSVSKSKIRLQASRFGICGGRNGPGIGFPPRSSVLLSQYISAIASHLQFIHVPRQLKSEHNKTVKLVSRKSQTGHSLLNFPLFAAVPT